MFDAYEFSLKENYVYRYNLELPNDKTFLQNKSSCCVYYECLTHINFHIDKNYIYIYIYSIIIQNSFNLISSRGGWCICLISLSFDLKIKKLFI